jgi:hypothetical protein
MFRYLFAAAALAAASTAASAASIDFTFDVAGSDVSVTPSGGLGCETTQGDPTPCITASLASSFGTPSMVTVEEGWENRYTFDFLTFTGHGWGGFEGYNVSATLAFSDPSEATTIGNGGAGVGLILGGYITGGYLHWNDVPQFISLANGSEVWISFESGVELFAGKSTTTEATIKVKSVAVPNELAPVPLPAGVLLLLGGLGTLAGLRRKT